MYHLKENAYAGFLPKVGPGGLVKVVVTDGITSAKVWVKIIASMLKGGEPILAGRLDQPVPMFLDIAPNQRFVFMKKHVHFIYRTGIV